MPDFIKKNYKTISELQSTEIKCHSLCNLLNKKSHYDDYNKRITRKQEMQIKHQSKELLIKRNTSTINASRAIKRLEFNITQ